jgi:hypothetical protein
MIRLGGDGRKPSFFEKKDQKTFSLTRLGGYGSFRGAFAFQVQTGKSFLLLFCKKEGFLS